MSLFDCGCKETVWGFRVCYYFRGLHIKSHLAPVLGRSFTATRISVNPHVPETKLLQNTFRKAKGSLKYLPSSFDTLEKHELHVTNLYKTVSKLIALLSDIDDMDAHYRYLATVFDFPLLFPLL